jgi:hypothetical protein
MFAGHNNFYDLFMFSIILVSDKNKANKNRLLMFAGHNNFYDLFMSSIKSWILFYTYSAIVSIISKKVS